MFFCEFSQENKSLCVFKMQKNVYCLDAYTYCVSLQYMHEIFQFSWLSSWQFLGECKSESRLKVGVRGCLAWPQLLDIKCYIHASEGSVATVIFWLTQPPQLTSKMGQGVMGSNPVTKIISESAVCKVKATSRFECVGVQHARSF